MRQVLQSATSSYYKVRQVLQNVTGYYKVRQVLQSATVLLNKIFDFSIKIFFQIIFCSYKILVIFLLQT